MSPAQDPLPPAEQRECVYVIGTPGSHVAKIGRSTNSAKRLADIQRMSPVPLEVLWTHPGGHELETRLHRHFSEKRSHGEWFSFDSDPVQAVKAAVEEKPWLKPKVREPVEFSPEQAAAMAALDDAFAAKTAEMLAIADPVERYEAARLAREEIAKGQHALLAQQRCAVLDLKKGRSWQKVGDLLDLTRARVEAIAKGRGTAGA